MHIGSVRTALYNYLFAKRFDGKFILRIEDTDEKRTVPGAEKYIKDSLKWLGIEPDEGPGYGGSYGPYRQSDRRNIYASYVDDLIASGAAYYAFDTEDELELLRKLPGKPFKYDHTVRLNLRNSLAMDDAEVADLIDSGAPYVVRFMVEPNEVITHADHVRGPVAVNTSEIDDKVIFKSSGMPTYHLASVVDDHLMEITHVIRGEEWLPSTHFHLLLNRALGFDAPEFYHLPLILGPNGKISKRDGDKYGFPVYPIEYTDPSGVVSAGYREMGYLPGALLNIVALLGWSPGDDVEYMTLDDMTDRFDPVRINSSGAKFDLTKALWLSREHIRAASDRDLAALMTNVPTPIVERVCGLVKERSSTLIELGESAKNFFEKPGCTVYDKISYPEENFLYCMSSALKDGSLSDAEQVRSAFQGAINASGVSPRDAGKVLRAALMDNKVGPSIFDIILVLGASECSERIDLMLSRCPVR